MDVLQYYYDDFYSYQKDERYIRLLFKPGVSLQTRELNNIQSMLQDQIGTGFASIYQRDAIVSGCEQVLVDTTYRVDKGIIFWNNYFIEIYEQLEFDTGGIDGTVGFKITQKRVGVPGASTAVDETDELLGDNASGFTNTGAEGADRLKIDIELALEANVTESDTVSFVPLRELETVTNTETLEDEQVAVLPDLSQLSELGDEMAQRTMEESGHYVVEGMRLIAVEDGANDVEVGASQGIAYVNGHRVAAESDYSIIRVATSRSDATLKNIPLESDVYYNASHVVSLNNDFPWRTDDASSPAIQANYIDFARQITTDAAGQWVFPGISAINPVAVVCVHTTAGVIVSTGNWSFDIGSKTLTMTGIAAPTAFYITYEYNGADNVPSGTFSWLQSVANVDHFDLDFTPPSAAYTSRLQILTGVAQVANGSILTNGGGDTAVVIDNAIFGSKMLINYLTTPSDPEDATADFAGGTFSYFSSDGTFAEADLYFGSRAVDIISSAGTFMADTNRVFRDGGTIELDYNIVLGRTDTIYLDQEGELIVAEGTYTEGHLDHPAVLTEPALLKLGTIKHWPYVEPLSNRTVYTYIRQDVPTRVTMRELNDMANRMELMEENIALIALETQTKDANFASSLRSIFVDDFIGFDRVNPGLADSNFAIHANSGTATLGIDRGITADDDNDFSGDAPITAQVVTHDDSYFYFLDRDDAQDITILNQPRATSTQLINGYSRYNKTSGVVRVRPDRDDHVSSIVTWLRPEIRERVVTVQGANVGWWENDWNWWGWWNQPADQLVETGRSSRVRRVTDHLISHCRTVRLVANARAWHWVDDAGTTQPYYIKAFFDGVPMRFNHRATGPYIENVGINGTFSYSIYVPPGIIQGVKEIKIVGYKDAACTQKFSEVLKSYHAKAIHRHITAQEIIFRDRIRTIRPANVDPLAQSFQFAKAQSLTEIEGYCINFQGLATKLHPILCQVRNMVNGYPGQDIFGETTLASADINYSTPNATTGGYDLVANTFAFTEPIYIPANTPFCITFLSESDEYSMFVAEIGKPDQATGTVVNKNPYLTGNLFSSSNNQTWTAHQTRDLTCVLKAAGAFDANGTLTFKTAGQFSRFIFNAEHITPAGTGIDLHYRYTSNAVVSDWLPMKTHVEIDLDTTAQQVEIRATLKASSDGKHSPLFYKERSIIPSMYIPGLQAVADQADVIAGGGLTSVEVTGIQDGYDKAKCIVDVYKPTGSCDIHPTYSFVDPATNGRKFIYNSWDTNPANYDEATAVGTLTVEALPDDGWYRQTYEFATQDATQDATRLDPNFQDHNVTDFRSKIVMLAPADGSASPKIRNLRWVLQQD